MTGRKILLAELRRQQETREPMHRRRDTSLSVDDNAFDFSKHAAYAEVRVAQAAGETLGIASPFFRRIDAVDGTRVLIDGRWVENFGSYDYLGLNGSPKVKNAAASAAQAWGVSATASRIVGGNRAIHQELESKLAGFVGTSAALAMVSGHATNLALIRTLLGPGDLILVDALAHNSIYEGIRASGAAHLSFPHNDWAWVEAHLAENRDQYRNVLIAIEGLYSMDGDAPDLTRFVGVKARHNAWLLVDEAHSIGVLGKTGRGICEEQGVNPAQVEMIMGTLSKTFCSCGGFVAGSEPLIDLLRFKAPGFVYSVGLSSPNTAASIASVDMIIAEPERVVELRRVGALFKALALERGLDCGASQGHAVAPIVIGDSAKATWLSNQLLKAGYNVLPIISPAVPNKSARLRFFLNVGHTDAAIRSAIDTTAELVGRSRDMGLADMRET
ncbi:MAG: aminotransferase class I/II-fold pyridoxal phosphate-dependent enzyme [Marinosulfonomonas sp.]|nr:aminotransferase class I/II-fold pyridoxal phosphate-dependent enzyme [Marinosulfonomonas sp.]